MKKAPKPLTRKEAIAKGFTTCCNPEDGEQCWELEDIEDDEIKEYKPRILRKQPYYINDNTCVVKYKYSMYVLIP